MWIGACCTIQVWNSRKNLGDDETSGMRDSPWDVPEMGLFFCLWLVDGAREGNSNWITAIGCLSLSPAVFPFVDGQNWLLGKCPTVYTIWGCKETVAHCPFQFIQNNMASAGVLWFESMYCCLSNNPAEGPKQTLCLHFGKCLVPWFLCTKIGERL